MFCTWSVALPTRIYRLILYSVFIIWVFRLKNKVSFIGLLTHGILKKQMFVVVVCECFRPSDYSVGKVSPTGIITASELLTD